MDEEILSRLYQNASKAFDLPDFETFKVDMQDEAKLSRFRESMISENFDIPDLETFKSDIGFGLGIEEREDKEDILQPEIAKVPEEIIERNKRWDKGEFLMEEKDAFEEYSKPENTEKRKKLEANEIFSNLETSLKNIPEEKITKETAKNYFKLDQRPVFIVTDSNVEPDFYENLTFKEYREKGLKEGFLTEEEARFYIGSGTKRVGKKYQTIDQYLSPEKLKEYNNYQKTGVLEALNANDEAEIKAAKNQSLDNLYKKETQLFLRNVPEKTKDLMGPFGTDKKYKNVDDAVKSLNLGREILIENNNKLKEDYNSYIEQAKPYQEGINNIIEKINDIEKNIPSGNVENGTDTQIKQYQILLAEAEKLQDEYEQKGLNTVYDNLAKQQKLNELNLDKFNNETRNVQTKAIIEKQLGLDYSLSARTGMALEEFFVGGLLNFGSLTSQLLLKGGKVLANPANSGIIDNITESIVQTTRDYNSKLAEKRETTIPDNITLDDIESENVNFFDWFGESLANNSPSIITTFVPGGAALKSGIMVKTATKAGEKAARNAAAKLVTAGTRTAQGIFFIGESGGRYGDLELQQGKALENLPKLKKQIEEELDSAKKTQMQEDYEDLERISNYSFAQKAFTSYAYGSAATLAETLGSLRIVNGAGKLASNIGKQQFKAQAYTSPLNFAANTTGKTISGISRNAGKAVAIEEAEETLTQVAHNVIDIVALKENKSIIDGIDKEFLANTAVTSFAIMAPKTMGNTRNMLKNEFTTRQEILNNQDDVVELIQLQEQFQALESGPEKTALRKKRRELLNKLAIADGMTLTKLNTLSNEEIVEAADLARQMRQLKNQMVKLGGTGDVSEAGIKARKQIQDQYNSINKRREDLLNKRLKKDRSKIKDLREELGESFVNLNAEYYFGLYDFYKNVAMTLMPKDGKFIVVDTKNKNWRDGLTNLSEEELAEVENLIETGNNATVVGNNIIINENVVNLSIAISGVFTEGAYAAAAPIEELFHIQNKAKNIVDKDGMLSEEATKAVDQAIEVVKNKFELGKISEQDYNDLITRFNLYKTGGKGKVVLKSGKRGKATADAEEIMAQMNNAVAIGALKLEDIETMPSIKDFINGISKDIFGDSSWMFDLKTANDVFNFIKNYQSNIQEGVKLALPDDEDETVKKFSKVEENKEIKEIFDEFTGPAENRKFKSKEEFTGIPILDKEGNIISYEKDPSSEFFDALLEIEQSNTLDASIRNTVSKSYLDINPGFVKEVKEKISDKFKSEYDASKNSLFGWLTGKNISGQPLINRASGDIQIKRGKKPSTVSADKKIGGEESRVTVGETLVSDEISPEDYADIKLAQDKIKKIKPEQSKIAKKIDLTDNEINLVKRDITNFLRKTDRPAMTDPKKFFKAFVDYVSTATGNRLYDKLSAPKDGLLSTKNRKAFIESVAEDLIALNKVDPSVMRRSNWNIFYELEIKNMNPTQTQKAIDEGRIPSTTNLKAGNDLFKTLDPSVDQVVNYLMNIRPDVFKRKMPKFLAEVIAKNEFNDIVNNKKQPIYDAKGNKTDRTIDLSESITEEEVTRGAPQVREKIARPEGIKFSKAIKLTPKDIQKLIELSSLRSINNATKKLNIKGKVTVTKDNRSLIQSKILKAIVDGKLGLVAFESMMPASGGAIGKRRNNGDKYYELSNGEEIIGERVFKGKLDEDGKPIQAENVRGKKIFNPPTIKQIKNKYGEGVTLVPKSGYIYYGKKDPAYIKAESAAINNDSENNYQRIPVGKDPIGKAWLDKKNRKGLIPKEQGELNFKAFEQAMLQIEKAVQNGNMDIETAALMILQGYQATSGIIKGVAEFKYRSRNMEFAKTRKQATGRVPFREEHNPPASVIGGNLIWAIQNGKVGALMPYIKKNYYQTQLSLADDLLLDLAKLDATLVEGTSILDNPIIRLAVAGINLNTILNIETGKSIIDEFGLGVKPSFEFFPGVVAFQNNLVKQVILESLDIKQAKKELNQYLKIAPQQQKANKFSKSILNDSKVLNLEGNLNMQDLLNKAATIDEALKIARDPNAPIKKIRVFDFDDTLATTKSDVLFTAPDGTEGKLNAEEFAKQGAQLLEEGYVFDFSEFNKVTKGKPGPLLDIAKKIQAARGTEDVFVLTARAPEAQVAIKEFLDNVGLNIPLKNITGLGNSTGEAKANWLVNKAAEGYNDFYFADDAYQNVKAVEDAMSVLDVKSKVQQAKVKFSKSVNKDFNKIIEQTTGIASEKIYSEAKAKVRGANKGNKKFFIPYSAEDFMGLIYPLLSKGSLGDSQMAWFKKNLLDPYAMANENIAADRIQLMEDFKALKKALEVPKDLRKKTDSGFTKEQAVRVYLFNKAGYDVPGISKTDLNELLDLVNSDGVLKAFGDQIFNITKGDSYAKPGENWLVGTITTDLIDVLNTVKRAKYLEQSGYTANAELIFSKENLNKLEAAYGAKYRESMENILGRMKSGKNRIFSGNRLSNRVLDYINNSTGAIMFFNTRSAVLQTISAINFLNWSFNNPIKAGAAFANQPQYWKDFVELINSDYLVDRRNGLKLNINESEIADAAATSKNKAKAAINYILQKGFLPTQFADSFAIASGGATFYRNRINDLVKNQGYVRSRC